MINNANFLVLFLFVFLETLVQLRVFLRIQNSGSLKAIDQRGHGERLCKKIVKHVI